MDIHKLLPFKVNGEFDSPYSFRAMIHQDFVYPDGTETILQTLFPPYQLHSVDHKADFNRLLNAQLTELREGGVTVRKVIVLQGGKPIYDFVP